MKINFIKRRHRKVKAIMLFLMVLLMIKPFSTSGQTSTRDLLLNNEIMFERLASENGLPNNNAFGMHQDRKGFMWFATLDGLIKYDGYTLTNYQNNPNDSNSLGDNIAMSVFEDHTGLIWVGTAGGGGVNSFDPQSGKWTRYPHSPDNPNTMGKGSIEDIDEDGDSTLWFGSSDGLTRYDPNKQRFTVFTNNPNDKYSLSSSHVFSVKADSKGRVWIGTVKGLNRFDSKLGQFHIVDGGFADSLLLKRTSVHHIYEDKRGLLWLSSYSNGVFVVDPESEKCIAHYAIDPNKPNGLGSNVILAITEDDHGDYWVSTNNGLYKFDSNNQIFTLYQNESYLPKTETKGHIIITDHAGLIWIGTIGRGIIYFSPRHRRFRQFLSDEASLAFGPGSNRIKSIFKATDKNLYVATSRNLLKFNPDKTNIDEVLQTKTIKGLDHRFIITTACERESGIFFLGTDGAGIIQYDIHSGKTSFIQNNPSDPESLANNDVQILYKDRSGKVWVGTQKGYLQWYDSVRNKFIRFEYNDKKDDVPPGAAIRFIHDDRNNDLWVGVKAFHMELGGNGIYHINQRTGKVTHYKHQPGNSGSLSNNGVTCFYEDSQGIIWIGTHGGGLNKLDPTNGKITVYDHDDGLLSNTVQRIAGDRVGNLWVMTDAGITRFNTTTLKTKQFGLSDGLATSPTGVEVDDYNAYLSLQESDGTIYFGSSNGLTVFHPNDIQQDTIKPPLAITQFRVFNQDYPIVANKVSLPYNKNFFDIHFVALSYLSSNLNQYLYKMEGVDKDWVNNQTQQIARYTNVAPGTYTFHVKGSNSDGVWNDTGETMTIIISPPWWRTWWAYTLYALLVIGSIWAFVYYRSRNLIKQSQLLQKQVDERTAEVVRQKEEIQNSLEDLKATQTQLIQSEKMASLGQLTAGIAHEIQNPLNFVNNFSDMNRELLAEMKEEIIKGSFDEVKSIASDVIENENKINHHGKRAEAIVKGMLQHSRVGNGQKEPTNINALADEYLRLSFHGLRAKDKSFNATTKTDFDQSIGDINIMSQNIGRVILNLLTNAFYAVTEKKKQLGANYEPTVSISTKRIGNKIEIKISDNGNGVPQKIIDKIFQPFFTTKPTGEGTGLGLSLSYDLIKAHGGDLKVTTREGEGSEFSFQIPVT